MNEKLYQVALTLTPGIGDVLIKQLISYCGSASEVFASNLSKLMRIPGIGETIARNITAKSILIEAERKLEIATKHHANILFYTDAAYPQRLKSLYDAPALLYYSGKADLNTSHMIAIVGTRQATDYGRAMTEDIVKALQEYQALIISGLAYGIDITAHRACLKHQMPTIGVMASGLDIVYPATHRKTAEAMLEQGGLLTENHFGVKPDPPRFPARNRIIAGMADAVIIVEAAEKGGALITAEYANNYHKEVFAVPGDLNRPHSQGCNKLIHANKATIFTNVKDLQESLRWNTPSEGAKAVSHSFADSLPLTEEESQVIALLKAHREMLIDELSWQSQIPLSRLASLLLNLEFQGAIKALPGKKFMLN